MLDAASEGKDTPAGSVSREADLRSQAARLAARTGFPDVPIADLMEGVGFAPGGDPMQRAKGILMALHREGKVNLATGDWSLATPRERAWGVTRHGERLLMVRFVGGEAPELGMPAREKPGVPPVAVGTDQVNPLVEGKRALRAGGYAPADVAAFVAAHYRRAAYAGLLEGQPNVYLVMPSTSRLNTVPEALAARLQRDFGGTIVPGAAVGEALATRQAKDRRGYLEKMRDPSRYALAPDLAARLPAGAHVVIVDDILTSGETLDGLSEALARQGIQPEGVATLGAIQHGAPANDSQIKQLALTLAGATGRRWKDVENDIRLAHFYSRTNLLKKANQEAATEPLAIHDLIAAKAAALRSAVGAGTGPGPDAGGTPGLPSAGTGGPGNIPPVPPLHDGPLRPEGGGATPSGPALGRAGGAPTAPLRMALEGTDQGVSVPQVLRSYAAIATAADPAGRSLPLRFGRFLQQVLGVYKPGAMVARIGNAGDLATAAHEVAHALQHIAFGDPNSAVLNRTLPVAATAELRKLGIALYSTKMPANGYESEGWAEYWRHHLTEDNATNFNRGCRG